MRYSFSEQLKSKKHPKYKGVYIVNAYGKTFHVQHFLDENMDHKGEWSILEITENEPYGEWVDTVCGKAVALIRIKQLYENKEIPFKKEIKKQDGIIISRGEEVIGTFKIEDNTLYFLDWFSREWEEYDHSFNLLTKEEIKKIRSKKWTKN